VVLAAGQQVAVATATKGEFGSGGPVACDHRTGSL
jgi:hypothetical protein